MRKPNAEALAFCILWMILAAVTFLRAGLTAGLLLSAGLFVLISVSSALSYATGSIALERGLRWAILIIAALALASYLDLMNR